MCRTSLFHLVFAVSSLWSPPLSHAVFPPHFILLSPLVIDTYNQERVFYTVIGFFLSFFAVFAAFLYPNR